MKSLRCWTVLYVFQTALFYFVFLPVSSKRCIYYEGPGFNSRSRASEKVKIQLNTTETGEKYQECQKAKDFCYTLWVSEPTNNRSSTITAQGCWDQNGNPACDNQDCVSKQLLPGKNDSKFCCCSRDFCNSNFTDLYSPTTTVFPTVVQYAEKPSNNEEAWILALIFCCTLIITVFVAVIFYHFCFHKKKPNSSVLRLAEPPPSITTAFDFGNLKVLEQIGRGRYGSVYRGLLYDKSVAVKSFSYQNKQYFTNERDIYTLSHMEHPNLLQFVGSCEERLDEKGNPEYILVLSYAPLGSLQNYLHSQTISWATLCKMSLSLTSGLAHLHTEVFKDDRTKPCIAHRDLTSRNVLIRKDETCMICDFGFAIGLKEGKYYQNGELQVAKTTSLADVGTLRYMAPEVLEGAVNLTDCESSLKQVDVYSLALILWEMSARCTDLFQGMKVPEYKLPFEEEIGLKPTMEQMQVLVSHKKARPLFPDIWKDTNPAIRILKETIADCWDQDAEARLTALCVVERLADLPTKWEQYKAGINNTSGLSPTFNLTKSSHQSLISSDVVINVPELSTNTCERDSSQENITNNSTNMSETETALKSSSNTKHNDLKNISKSSISSKFSVPLQPHQGRNPSIERNLMKQPTEDVVFRGNMILEKGRSESEETNWEQDVYSTILHLSDTENDVLMPNQTSEQSRRLYHPIPFVQNTIHCPNIIPNNSIIDSVKNNHSNNRQEKKNRYNQSTKGSLRGLFELGRISKESVLEEGEEEETQPLSPSLSNGTVVRKTNDDITYRNYIPPPNQLPKEDCVNFTNLMGRSVDSPKEQVSSVLEKCKNVRMKNNMKIPHINGYNVKCGRDPLLVSINNHSFIRDTKPQQENGNVKHIDESFPLTMIMTQE